MLVVILLIAFVVFCYKRYKADKAEISEVGKDEHERRQLQRMQDRINETMDKYGEPHRDLFEERRKANELQAQGIEVKAPTWAEIVEQDKAMRDRYEARMAVEAKAVKEADTVAEASRPSGIAEEKIVTESATDLKECPFCAETIRAKATVCRFCKSRLEPALTD